ncbi:MAG: stress responsive alpha-beta barrel protein [Pedosphaera sp.]|nr:stress responsive alpha-beta barrel protein [Pedosphaera sp.]
MKYLVICLIPLLGLALTAFAAETVSKKEKLRHVVAFKFKDSATKEQIKQVEEAFRALKSKIPQVVSIEWGTNVSPEKLDKGFTHGFIVTFNNEKDRDAYLIHPEHKKFVDLALPLIGDAFVIDFVGKN